MTQVKKDLAERIQALEKELQIALHEKEQAFSASLGTGEAHLRRRDPFSTPQAQAVAAFVHPAFPFVSSTHGFRYLSWIHSLSVCLTSLYSFFKGCAFRTMEFQRPRARTMSSLIEAS
jgi:hypothetical protein